MVARSAPFSSHNSLSIATPNQGFIFTEILFFFSIAAIVATIVLALINPAARAAQSANASRQSELIQLRDALESYANAHNGSYPTTRGEYWCQNCTFADYTAKGVNNWIPELVAQDYVSYLPQDIATSNGTACNPTPGNSYSGYVYYSPSPPNNTDYKLFAFCTPPNSALNTGSASANIAYCTSRPPYDSANFNPRPAGQPELKPFVDPARPSYAYAIYTPGLACL